MSIVESIQNLLTNHENRSLDVNGVKGNDYYFLCIPEDDDPFKVDRLNELFSLETSEDYDIHQYGP